MSPRLSVFALVASSALTLACSNSASSPSPNADGKVNALADAGTPAADASPAASAPCPEGSRASGGACETKLSLAVSKQTLMPARDHHTTHVIESGGSPYLYVFGGTPSWQTVYDDIQRAKIASDGSLGAFEPAGTMPNKRAGHMSARVKDKIILVAGTSMTNRMFISGSVDVGSIQSDGSIGAFVAGPDLPEGVMHHIVAVKGDYLFVFGGRGETTGASVTQVARAKIAEDSMPGAFVMLAPLPEARSHAMGFQYGDWVPLVGGMTGDPLKNPPNRADVVRARLGDDGSVGEWEKAGALPKGGLSVGAAEVFARQVFMLGGLVGGTDFTKNVYAAPIDAEGMLGAFAVLPAKLPTARGHVHQTPMHGRTIYSVGDRFDSEASTAEVVTGTFEAN